MKKKYNCICCNKELKTEKEVFLYFDPNNIAITKSMSKKYFCAECLKKYEENKIKTFN